MLPVIGLSNLASLRRRYDMYDWEDRYRYGRILSLWLSIFGVLLVIIGLLLAALLVAGKIPLPYSPTTRLVLALSMVILGLLLGSGMLALSQILHAAIDTEQSTRYAANIWFILEEHDLAEEEAPVASYEDTESGV
jgi:hypothetical protein